jgi:DHHC palmitoyltransferase
MTGGLYIFFRTTWKHIPGPAVSSIHWYDQSELTFLVDARWIVLLVVPAPYISLYVLSRSDPGIITPQNHINHVDLFPYDNIIFSPHIACRTCQFSKPARSKHCNVCNACVARHDHHCTPKSLPKLTKRRMDRKLRGIFQYTSLPPFPSHQRILSSIWLLSPLPHFLVQSSADSVIPRKNHRVIWCRVAFGSITIDISTLLVGYHRSRIRWRAFSHLWHDMCCCYGLHARSFVVAINRHDNQRIIQVGRYQRCIRSW